MKKYVKILMSALLVFAMLLPVAISISAEEIAEPVAVEEELQPMTASNCPEYVPGIGWTGSKEWRNVVAQVRQGGTITGVGPSGVFVTEAVAFMLIGEAGGTESYVEGPHLLPNPHCYWHVHYTMNNTRQNSIRIQK